MTAPSQSDKPDDGHIPGGTDLAAIADRIRDEREQLGPAVGFRLFLYRHESIDVEAALRTVRPECGTLSGETPRTDAIERAAPTAVGWADFARQLERELAEATKARDTLALLSNREPVLPHAPLSGCGDRREAVKALRGRLGDICEKEWDEQPSGEGLLCGKDAVLDFLHSDEVEKALLAALLPATTVSASGTTVPGSQPGGKPEPLSDAAQARSGAAPASTPVSTSGALPTVSELIFRFCEQEQIERDCSWLRRDDVEEMLRHMLGTTPSASGTRRDG